MRPRGPLPPRVYWTRRMLLVLIVVVLMSVVWWLVAGTGQANENADSPTTGQHTTTAPTQTPSAPAVTDPSQPLTERPSETPSDQTPNDDTRADDKPGKSKKPDKVPLAASTGDCKPKQVDMKIDVSDSKPGQENTATMLLRSTDTPACTLAITPDTMVVRITSGEDVIWSSDDCPDALRVRELVARADPPTPYAFKWNGQRSSENCQRVDTLPQPGGYWVEAALIGGDPHRAYFDIKASRHG